MLRRDRNKITSIETYPVLLTEDVDEGICNFVGSIGVERSVGERRNFWLVNVEYGGDSFRRGRKRGTSFYLNSIGLRRSLLPGWSLTLIVTR